MKARFYLSLTIAAALLSGCAGATRLPMRAKGPADEHLETPRLDLSLLDTPGTRRDEVVKRLGSIDTSYQNARLFWGRWSDSKWGYWWFVAGNNYAAGDAKRLWHVHNLLVSFDEYGVLQKKAMFGDNKSLWAELHAQLANAPTLDLSQPIPLDVRSLQGLNSIKLAKDSVQFERTKGKVPVLLVSPRDIVRFSHNRIETRFRPSSTCHALHFAEKTAWGKSVLFCADPADVATLFQYLQQAGAPTLRWD